jgi:transcription elongation factor Elf1
MEQNFDCLPCGFTSTNRYNYDIHVRTVKHKARMEGLKCEQCGAFYDSRNKLTRHMKNVHIKKEKRISEYLSAVAASENKEETIPETSDTTTVVPPTLTPISLPMPIVKPIITKKPPKINIKPKLGVNLVSTITQEPSSTKKVITIVPK